MTKIKTMKQFLIFFVLCFSFFSLVAQEYVQYYQLPEWAEDLPYSGGSAEIYAIGVSDPRMEDKSLAVEVATQRAIAMAVMLNESTIYYASDYFEKKSEEYRWFVMTEDVQELGKIQASTWVDKNSYQVISTAENTNGETMVLIKFIPSVTTDTNYFVTAEYYRQDFEVSNTRAMESVRSIKFSVSWLEPKTTDTLKSYFHMTNWNGSISTEIKYNNKTVSPPGYSYEYASSIPDTFDIKLYNTSVSLKKGLWIAYIDSYLQSIMKISKNYSVKFGTVNDDYKVNRNDGITEYSIESLSRSSCKNVLSFEYGGMGIHKNQLYPRVSITGERPLYVTYKELEIRKEETEKKSKKCWFKRLFCKKSKDKNKNDEQ